MDRNILTIRRIKQVSLWSITVLLSMLTGLTAFGQSRVSSNSWAVKMFTEVGTAMTHNFGDLALHAEAEQRFRFRNLYKEDVEIAGDPQSSCGCTKVTVTKKIIKSGETAEIIARVDTTGKVHVGKRKATITVFFRRPYVAEVQLQVQSFIRSDVIFEPGIVEFGGVGQGAAVTKTVLLQYNGPSMNWQVTGLKKTSPAIRAEAKVVARQNNKKTYQVDVQLLPTAEPGYVNDLLLFSTTDSGNTGSIFIPIHGLIYSSLSVKPTYLQFGVIHPGESVTKNLVVRGSTPFRIAKVSSNDSRMQFKTANQESTVHVIPVSFSAAVADSLGEFRKNITVKTSLSELPDLEIAAFGIITDNEEEDSKSEESVTDNDGVSVRKSAHTIDFAESFIQSWKEYRKRTDSPALGMFGNDEWSELNLASQIPQPSESEEMVPEREKPLEDGIRQMGENLRALRKTSKRSLSPQAIESPAVMNLKDPQKKVTKQSFGSNNRLFVATMTSNEDETTFSVARPINVNGDSPLKIREGTDNNAEPTEETLSFELPVPGFENETPVTEKTNEEEETEVESKQTAEFEEEETGDDEGWVGVSVTTGDSSSKTVEKIAMNSNSGENSKQTGDRSKPAFRKPTLSL